MNIKLYEDFLLAVLGTIGVMVVIGIVIMAGIHAYIVMRDYVKSNTPK